MTGAAAGGRIVQAGEVRSARIEALRALAALSVVLSHAFVFSYGLGPQLTNTFGHRVLVEAGFGGVSFFFVLSGYLLFWPFARGAFGDGGEVRVRRYAANRIVRILPLYYFIVALLLVAQHDGGSWNDWWHYLLFLQNFDSATLNTLDVPMWSLAIEAQFYLLLPLLAIGLARVAGGSLGRAGALLFVLGAASFAAELLFVRYGKPPSFRVQYSLASVLDFFAGGMGLALLRLHWERHPPRWLAGPLGSATAWLLAAVPLWVVVCWDVSFWTDPAKLAACMLVLGAFVLPLRDGPLSRVTDARGLSRLGVASYSLYLWHVPVIIALTSGSLGGAALVHLHPTGWHVLGLFAGAAALATLLSVLTYRLVEAPALRLRRRWSMGEEWRDRAPAPVLPAPAG